MSEVPTAGSVAYWTPEPPDLDPRWDWIKADQLDGTTQYIRGLCRHLEAIPVESIVDGVTVAHLCTTCGTQLPEEWQP